MSAARLSGGGWPLHLGLLAIAVDGGAEMIDVQMESPHVARFGARGIPHGEFMARLARALAPPPG